MRFRVYFEDTDAMRVVYHANYFRFLERARSEAFMRAGRLEALNNSGGFVVASISANYLAPALLGDIIDVKTATIKIGRASCEIEQKIFLAQRGGGEGIDCSTSALGSGVSANISASDDAASTWCGAELFNAKLKLVHVNNINKPQIIDEQLKEFLMNLSD